MSHNISVILAHENVLTSVLRDLPGATLHAAPQQTALIPVGGSTLEKLGSIVPARPGTFRYLTPALEELVAAWSRRGAVAYLETEYFGGLGRQSSIVFRHGDVVVGPLMHDSTPGGGSPRTPVKDLPINTALRALGIVATGSMDEFDTIGFGAVRSNQDWP